MSDGSLAKRDRRTIAGWLKNAAEDAVAAAGAAPKNGSSAMTLQMT